MNSAQRRKLVRGLLKEFRDLSETDKEKELAKAVADNLKLARRIVELERLAGPYQSMLNDSQ